MALHLGLSYSLSSVLVLSPGEWHSTVAFLPEGVSGKWKVAFALLTGLCSGEWPRLPLVSACCLSVSQSVKLPPQEAQPHAVVSG